MLRLFSSLLVGVYNLNVAHFHLLFSQKHWSSCTPSLVSCWLIDSVANCQTDGTECAFEVVNIWWKLLHPNFFWYQLCNCNLLCFQTKVVVISSLELYRRQTHALHHPQRVLLSKMEQLQTHNLMVWSGRSGNQKRSVNWSAIFIIGSKPKSTISFWWCNDHEHNCWLHLLFQ